MVSQVLVRSVITNRSLVPIATRFPRRNVRFEVHDLREQLRWGDGTFDLIHARDLSMGVSYPVPISIPFKFTRRADRRLVGPD